MVACNTATAQALEEIQAEVDIPVLGVIGAAARVAAPLPRTEDRRGGHHGHHRERHVYEGPQEL